MPFNLRKISGTYKHINRYTHILKVLMKYGFASLLERLKITQYIESGLKLIHSSRGYEHYTAWERMRFALEELGPAFVKFGQILSTRVDILPLPLILELEKLQDNVSPFSYEEMRKILQEEYGKNPEDVFASFECAPLAAASIGQVHKAVLKTGEHVILKVQRPNIHKTVEIDGEIMMHFAEIMERNLAEAQHFKPTQLVVEFMRNIRKELDYSIEAANLRRFSGEFAGDNRIYVPDVYEDYTTERILVMSYVDGLKVSDILLDSDYDKKIVAARGADLILKQIFDNGFFHLDPHPGNIFILPENRICFIDFGMMGIIDIKSRESFVELIYNVVKKDEKGTAEALLAVAQWDDRPDMPDLYRDIADFITRFLYLPIKNIEMGKLLSSLLEISSKHHLFIPPNLFMMLKAIVFLEALGKTLDPDFVVVDFIAPFIKKIKMAQYYPNRLGKDAADVASELFELVQSIPDEARDILKLIKRGKIKIEFEHHRLEPMITAHSRISNRIVLAIIIAALIIGSSLIIHSKTPPFFEGIPAIGVAGFIFAAVMGFVLIVSIAVRK